MCLCKEMVMIAHKALVQCSCINFNSITLKATHKGRKITESTNESQANEINRWDRQGDKKQAGK